MKLSPRHLVWVNLVLLALVAYGGASTVSMAIAARLAPPPDLHLSPVPPPLKSEPHRPASYYATIQTRDIFNSSKPAPPDEGPPPTPAPTLCKLKLWGVVVHSQDSSSCAIVEDQTTHKQELYRIGEVTPGCGTVKSVEWDRVILDHDGRDEILDLTNPNGLPVPAVAAAPVAPGPSADSHVQQVSDTEYRVDRSEVDAALDNMNQLFTQIRAVPHFEGGKSVGFRLFAIRANSIFDKIGLRNGDIIQEINGNDINDPAKALELFQRLRNERQLSVKVVRNKETKTFSYDLGG